MKLFSIITVCFNCKAQIDKTIQSVLSQDRSLFEYIVIDGKSTDGTMDIISSYNNIDVVISEPDKGIYDAMNKGIAKATGEYINFMNAGDTFFSSDVLSKVSKMMDKGIDVIFGDKSDIRDGIRYRIKAMPFYDHLPLHQSMGFNHQCTFVKTSTAKRYPFDLTYKLAADYNMVISIFKSGGSFQQIDLIVANFDLSGASNANPRYHMYERLCIDYPNRNFLNIIISWYRYIKLVIVRLIRYLILMVNPKLIALKRERNKNFEIIK